MARYTLAVGTHDPEGVSAETDAEAVQRAVSVVSSRFADDLRDNPQEVATLLGPAGLITRPSERLDEFVARVAPTGDADVLQPGDLNSPDCNGD